MSASQPLQMRAMHRPHVRLASVASTAGSGVLFVMLSVSRLGAQGSTPPYLADTLPPYFNIKAYCAGVGDGSNGLELTCRQKERAAEDSIIQRGHTPARIMRDCSRIAADREQADIGSYSLLYTCIKDEEAARRKPQ